MSYRGGGPRRRRRRGDHRPLYGYGGAGGGRRSRGFVWPPPVTTPRSLPAQYEMPRGYRAPIVLPHQEPYGAMAAVYRAPVTIRAPPCSASSSSPPAPRQLAKGAPTRVYEAALALSAPSDAALAKEVTRVSEAALASSAPSDAALAKEVTRVSSAALGKEVENKPFVSDTALAPSAAKGVPASDLAPVSKKGLAHTGRPGVGTVGKKVKIRSNFNIADNNIFDYDVS